MNEKNMWLWEKYSKTNKKNTKEVSYGKRKFTAIDAYSQIKNATELWGPFGVEWYIEDEEYTLYREDTFCLYEATLVYPVTEKTENDEEITYKGKIPLSSDIEVIGRDKDGQVKYNQDWAKKVKTDAMTKGLSYLGFNADIFLGEFKDNKYVDHDRINFEDVKKKLKNMSIQESVKYYHELEPKCVSQGQKNALQAIFADHKKEQEGKNE